MQDEYYCIEQLDLAAQQLERVDPGYARFALILTDNIVELMLYRKCKQEIIRDDGFFSYGQQYCPKNEYDKSQRKAALGQHFDKRLKFCRNLGWITESELEFMLTVHRYRNEVYHVGILHNDLLYPIAWQYHELACDLFERLSPLYHCSSSSDCVSAAVRQHTGEEGIRLAHADEDIAMACKSLKSMKPPLSPTFPRQLSVCAVSRAYDFGNALHFLTDHGKVDESEVLVELQFDAFLFDDDSPFADELAGIQNEKEYKDLRDKTRLGWKPKVSKSPTERWIGRAEQLSSEKCPKAAMKKFQSLLDEMSELGSIVRDAAERYENHLQSQFDLARGK